MRHRAAHERRQVHPEAPAPLTEPKDVFVVVHPGVFPLHTWSREATSVSRAPGLTLG